MSTQAHRQQIMDHFKAGNSITERESIELWGKHRLAARIEELRELHNIYTGFELNGNGGRHGRYFYMGKKKNG